MWRSQWPLDEPSWLLLFLSSRSVSGITPVRHPMKQPHAAVRPTVLYYFAYYLILGACPATARSLRRERSHPSRDAPPCGRTRRARRLTQVEIECLGEGDGLRRRIQPPQRDGAHHVGRVER